MNSKPVVILNILIAIAAIIFLGLAITGRVEGNLLLILAFICMIASNVMNILRVRENKKGN